MRKVLLGPVCPVGHGSVMYRREVLMGGGYNEKYGSGEVAFLFMLAREGKKIGYVPDPIYKYRISTTSHSSMHRRVFNPRMFRFIDDAYSPAEHPLINGMLKAYNLGLATAKVSYEKLLKRR